MLWIRAVLLTTFILCALLAIMIYAVTTLLPFHSDVIAYISLDNGRQVFMKDIGHNVTIQLTNVMGELNHITWSPDGSRLAYNLDGDICLLHVPRSQSRCVTSAVGTVPAWSPDGSQLAYTGFANDRTDIYVIDANGTNDHRLTEPPTVAYHPTWSPDGQFIAYVSYSLTDPLQIFVMHADGSDPHRITPTSTDDGLTLSENNPAWSPDGRWLAYIGQSDANPGLFRIHLLSLADNHVEILSPETVSVVSNWGVSWSPDSSRIAFTTVARNRYRITIIDLQTRALTYLSPPGAYDLFPAWRP